MPADLGNTGRGTFNSPEAALLNPRSLLAWAWPLMRRLGFPEPDKHWRSTAQVNWTSTPSFWVRFLCLYLGHDFYKHKIGGRNFRFRLDCKRCGWEGPWTQ